MMLKTFTKSLGTIYIGNKNELFDFTIHLMNTCIEEKKGSDVVWGLGGGSTPQAFFEWSVANKKISDKILKHSIWSCSDERHVPLSSKDSNFGNAERHLLDPLHVEASRKLIWPTDLEPEACVVKFMNTWDQQIGENKGFDICFLGMGDDCHIASLFPKCPLIQVNPSQSFAATEWPGRGWRLTITPKGLEKCSKIVLTVLGKNKAQALKTAFTADFNPSMYPAHLLKTLASKVYWLLDDEAAAELTTHA